MENKSSKKKTSKSKKTSSPSSNENKDVKKEIKNNDNINVAIPLGFLKHVNNVVLIANQRAHWQPNELIPVGTVLRELDSLIRYYSTLEVTDGKSNSSTTETTSSS